MISYYSTNEFNTIWLPQYFRGKELLKEKDPEFPWEDWVEMKDEKYLTRLRYLVMELDKRDIHFLFDGEKIVRICSSKDITDWSNIFPC